MLSVEVQNLGQVGASQILVKVSSILNRKEPSTEQTSAQCIEKIGIGEEDRALVDEQGIPLSVGSTINRYLRITPKKTGELISRFG